MLTAEKKAEKIAWAERHAAQDLLRAGHYWDGKTGCSVGCDAREIFIKTGERYSESGIHATVADYFGTPEWLEHLRDAVFEGLPEKRRSEWHTDLAKALPVGVDFEPARHRIQADVLRKIALPSITWGENYVAPCRAAVGVVAALHEASALRKVSDEEWTAARSAAESARSAAWARSAAESAAESAARSAAESSARSAAWSAARAAARAAASAARAAESAARSAAWSAARAAARAAESAAWITISKITLEHLRAEALRGEEG